MSWTRNKSEGNLYNLHRNQPLKLGVCTLGREVISSSISPSWKCGNLLSVTVGWWSKNGVWSEAPIALNLYTNGIVESIQLQALGAGGVAQIEYLQHGAVIC